MSKLAIGVRIDESSLRPETARFIYEHDPQEPSQPWLKNSKGDVALPATKAPVAIQFRLLQEFVTLADQKVYALSLPTGALQIEGPVPGKWPTEFNTPVQSGKPGKPHDTVVVIDKNSDVADYKYAFGVLFTPHAGPVVKRIDDPRIRNGGDTRFAERWLWPVLVLVLVLIALVAWRVAASHSDPVAKGHDAQPLPAPRATKVLDLAVTLTPKGRTPLDGLFFSFLPKDFSAAAARYLDDAAGNITIPADDPDIIAITFHIPEEIIIGGVTHRLGFNLPPPSPGKPPRHPFSLSRPPMQGVFEIKPVEAGSDNRYLSAGIEVQRRDQKNYNFQLAVGVEDKGTTNVVEHDPRIRNGGVKLDPGPIDCEMTPPGDDGHASGAR